ncbi:nicotinate-nucleotide adenylyltransferase [Erwinia sp. CPCC 100877]|nr:nicotinate-nucleotide adenylyltransferase [Erwinia sp. CPCC 100877]
MTDLYAIYGGTFDPVHYGHLRPVEALARIVGLKQVTIMPNNVPPHRPQPEASSEQRRDMVNLAIRNRPLFRLDERELQRTTPSWTVETLETVRRELGPQQPLAFIIGQDSLTGLPGWHRYETLMDLCHLLVCRRPGYAPDMPNAGHQDWLNNHLTHSVGELHRLPAGRIFMADTPLWDISATGIRQRLAARRDCEALVPEAVLDYINKAGLYR